MTIPNSIRLILLLATIGKCAGIPCGVNAQEFQAAIKNWERLTPIESFTTDENQVVAHLDYSIAETGDLITFTTKNDESKPFWKTIVKASVLNVPGGLTNLSPLVQANERRFKNMMTTRGLRVDTGSSPSSPRREIFLNVVSACVDAKGNIYFEVKVKFSQGRAFTISGEPELWCIRENSFELLKLPTTWAQGG